MSERGYIDWKPYSKSRELLEETLAVFKEYAKYRPLTVRQVFYEDEQNEIVRRWAES